MVVNGLVPALERQRQVVLCELEASLVYTSLVYTVISRTARAIEEDPVSKNKKENQVTQKSSATIHTYSPVTQEARPED